MPSYVVEVSHEDRTSAEPNPSSDLISDADNPEQAADIAEVAICRQSRKMEPSVIRVYNAHHGQKAGECLLVRAFGAAHPLKEQKRADRYPTRPRHNDSTGLPS